MGGSKVGPATLADGTVGNGRVEPLAVCAKTGGVILPNRREMAIANIAIVLNIRFKNIGKT
ncbi:hypothetical protein [Okeania sp. SIO2C9]|uniref:hypothetical protein n=1 Tax=Okeania sp. SIO2C9 TaxID=2607791 RepID=UPI0025D602B2|nr:hypothetical protein [Okeania sp. SIO2C9]